MSTAQETPSGHQVSRSQRVLACVLCQQRKVKCDRRFPCANCIKSRAQCVPATLLPRRPRRKIPERDLVDRLRRYEDLLRQNNIKFEPDDDATSENDRPSDAVSHEHVNHSEEADEPSPATTTKSSGSSRVKNFWHAMRERYGSDNDSGSSQEEAAEATVLGAWDQLFSNDDHLIFGARQTTVDLSSLHPEPAQIFKFWQIFLDNVNPLLRVVHTPTMQARVIEAISDLKSMSPAMEALMFSIYCIAVVSVLAEDFTMLFGAVKLGQNELLSKYQFGCQQALLNSGFLRSTDRDNLTALYLYLISVSMSTDPRSLSSMLGLAIRIGQRMRIDTEAACAEQGVLEGEMRRRLWWALVHLDVRVGQLADYKPQTFTPVWDCRVPLNVNDADLRPDMKEPPAVHPYPTEAIYAVVRSFVAEFLMNTALHLDYVGPRLKPIARMSQRSLEPGKGELDALEQMVEENYLQYCSEENPLQFLTIWETRGFLAKIRLLENYINPSSLPRDVTYLDKGVFYARQMLECDTKIMASALTKPFHWTSPYHFPFPAYIALANELRRKPHRDDAHQMWEIMSDNSEVRFNSTFQGKGAFFNLFFKVIMLAWWARQKSEQPDDMPEPRIISKLKQTMEASGEDPWPPSEPKDGLGHDGSMTGFDYDQFVQQPIPPYSMPGQMPFNMDMNFGMPVMDWGIAQPNPWPGAPFL